MQLMSTIVVDCTSSVNVVTLRYDAPFSNPLASAVWEQP